MVYNRFYLVIVIRVLFLMITCLVISFYALQPGKVFTMIFFTVLLAMQVIDMIRYVNITNREISGFLSRLTARDSGLSFQMPGNHRSFKDIGFAIEQLRSEMEESRREVHLQSYYINKVLEKVTVGIISFDSSGIIGLYNPEAARILGVRKPKNISALDDINPGISDILKRMKPGIPESVQLKTNDELVPVSLNRDMFSEDGERFSVVSIHNMGRVLDEKEMESWQKLIRVLRHEIMNSITPITTLTVAIKRKLKRSGFSEDANSAVSELTEELVNSIDLIEDRGKGLIQFVDRYRDITSLPAPRMQELRVEVILRKTRELFIEECNDKSIEFTSFNQDPDLFISADESMIMQVLINLVRNSVTALKQRGGGIIHLSAGSESEWAIIRVKDDGPGIPDEIMDKIFIPFFTTSKEGSGIGLSLARQIMRMHKGTISFFSNPDNETVFTLRFPLM
jgi:two-component system, NtrC family, nitrogen regulation sensor histidine kinase NtrY